MRLNRTELKNRLEEHVDDVTGHVFIEPKDEIGRRVEPPRIRLNRKAPSVRWVGQEAGFRID